MPTPTRLSRVSGLEVEGLAGHAASLEHQSSPRHRRWSLSHALRAVNFGSWSRRGSIALLGSMLAIGSANAQTNPVAQALPYTQDFRAVAATSTVYPAGWQGWINGASGAAYLTTGPTLDQALLAVSSHGQHDHRRRPQLQREDRPARQRDQRLRAGRGRQHDRVLGCRRELRSDDDPQPVRRHDQHAHQRDLAAVSRRDRRRVDHPGRLGLPEQHHPADDRHRDAPEARVPQRHAAGRVRQPGGGPASLGAARSQRGRVAPELRDRQCRRPAAPARERGDRAAVRRRERLRHVRPGVRAGRLELHHRDLVPADGNRRQHVDRIGRDHDDHPAGRQGIRRGGRVGGRHELHPRDQLHRERPRRRLRGGDGTDQPRAQPPALGHHADRAQHLVPRRGDVRRNDLASLPERRARGHAGRRRGTASAVREHPARHARDGAQLDRRHRDRKPWACSRGSSTRHASGTWRATPATSPMR